MRPGSVSLRVLKMDLSVNLGVLYCDEDKTLL